MAHSAQNQQHRFLAGNPLEDDSTLEDLEDGSTLFLVVPTGKTITMDENISDAKELQDSRS